MDARQPGCLSEQATAERSLGASRKDRPPRGLAQPAGVATVAAAVPLRAEWWSPAGRLPGPCGLRAGGPGDGRAAGALPGPAGGGAGGGGAGGGEGCARAAGSAGGCVWQRPAPPDEFADMGGLDEQPAWQAPARAAAGAGESWESGGNGLERPSAPLWDEPEEFPEYEEPPEEC